jgi:hypothetical protein
MAREVSRSIHIPKDELGGGEAVLAPVGFQQPLLHPLRNPVGRVHRFGIPCPELILARRQRHLLGILADRAHADDLLHLPQGGGADHVQIDQELVVDEIGGGFERSLNPFGPGVGEVHDYVRPRGDLQQAVIKTAKVELVPPGAHIDIVPSFEQLLHDMATEKARTAGDTDSHCTTS